MREVKYVHENAMRYYDQYDNTPCATIPYCSGSDYSGDSVTQSNFYLLKKMLNRYRGFYLAYGYYGTYSIVYIENELTRKGKALLQDILKQLEDYPCLDDEYLVEFEANLIDEYITDMYKFWHIDLPIDDVKRIVYDNSLAIIEMGCVVYIDEDKLVSICNAEIKF